MYYCLYKRYQRCLSILLQANNVEDAVCESQSQNSTVLTKNLGFTDAWTVKNAFPAFVNIAIHILSTTAFTDEDNTTINKNNSGYLKKTN